MVFLSFFLLLFLQVFQIRIYSIVQVNSPLQVSNCVTGKAWMWNSQCFRSYRFDVTLLFDVLANHTVVCIFMYVCLFVYHSSFPDYSRYKCFSPWNLMLLLFFILLWVLFTFTSTARMINDHDYHINILVKTFNMNYKPKKLSNTI